MEPYKKITKAKKREGRAIARPFSQVQKRPSQITPALSMTLMHTQTEVHRGPLPHPQTLAGYEVIVPGSAGMIMDEFREQGAHRRRLEAMVVEGDQRRANYGLLLGYIGLIALERIA